MSHAHNYKDLTGQKLHRLTFLEFVGTTCTRNALWKVRCDCGTEFVVPAVMVKNGNTKSCGCIKIERCREILNRKQL